MTAWVLQFNHRNPVHYFAGQRRDRNTGQTYEALTTDVYEAVHYHSEADAIMNRAGLVNGEQNYTPVEVQN